MAACAWHRSCAVGQGSEAQYHHYNAKNVLALIDAGVRKGVANTLCDATTLNHGTPESRTQHASALVMLA